MRRIFSGLIVTVLTAAPLAAQDAKNPNDWQNSAGYITGLGGFQAATGSTTGDALIEGGVRVAPHVMVFGDLGWFRNLQSDLAPTLNTTVTSLQTNQGLSVTGGGTLPAVYSIGGVKLEMPVSNMFLPYVLGGAGIARLNPSPTFSFVGGVMPDGSSPTAGQDVTSALTTSGVFTVPTASTAFMYTLGGGVQVPIAPRVSVDLGYRLSRINSDTPVNAQSLMAGVGFRF